MKLPLPEVVGSPQKRERFITEAETWIRMGVHPHIVRCWFVHKVVGLPALFLDLVTGGSVEDKIRSGELGPGSWAAILKALLQVAEGLVHAHTMGVVHRDIKPENLLVKRKGQVCVTDFGLVKSLSSQTALADSPDGGVESRSQDPGITGTAQFLGTPRYGAPEQWNKTLSIGPTTDIYALGVILFEMLCGRRPFDAPNEPVEVLELIQRHLTTPAPDPRQFRPDVPEPLALLALRCLQKEQSQRPQSMKELLSLLAHALGQVSGESYRPPHPVPGGDRADLLNNAAYSLYSLGKIEKARELLQRGLQLEAGHPECLYNLVQIERREGSIAPAESLRRLRRANARYQLALLCIEEGLGKQAMDLIDSFPESEKNGLIYRTQGDAFMYAKQYLAAQRSYEKALQTMPSDQPTRMRKVLAAQGLRGVEGHVFFPSSVSCYKNRAPNSDLELRLSDDSRLLIGINAQEIVMVDVDTEAFAGHGPRPPEAGPVLEAWSAKGRLLLQDSAGYELWDTSEELKMLQRGVGRVLAAGAGLKRLVLLGRDGVTYADKLAGTSGLLQFPPGTQPSGSVQACFTADERGMCIVTPSGQIGQVDAEFRVIPLPWPASIEHHADICCLKLSSDGVFYCAHRSGLFQGYNFAARRRTISFSLPFLPKRLYVDKTGQTIVVSGETHCGVFNSNGELLFRGEGAFCVTHSGQYGIGWVKGNLTLFELNPFRRVRSWAEEIGPPKCIHIARDGRRAATLLTNGEHHAWELDEENRVYEQSLLLTPGQTYEDLISGHNDFRQAYAQAQQLYQAGDYHKSHLALRRARAVKGYFQAPEALNLHRELSQRLTRGGLEAIWERLNLTEVTGVAMSPDRIAVSRGESWTLMHYRDSAAGTITTGELGSAILGLHFFEDLGLAAVDRLGNLLIARSLDGDLVRATNLQIGELTRAHFWGNSLFVTGSDSLFHIDLTQCSVTSRLSLPSRQIGRLFPLSRERVVVTDSRGAQIWNLRQAKPEGPVPIKATKDLGELTYAAEIPEKKLFLAGFADGGLCISDLKSGKVHVATNRKLGPVTGIGLALQMAVGVEVSAAGRLALFDLGTGEIHERFTAHSEPVSQVSLSEDAQYMVTRTAAGNCRLWELSWALTQSTSPLSIDWLPTGALDRLGMLFKPR